MYRPAACAVLALMAGCATLTESTQQLLLVQTVLDSHEVGGVGCVLYNDVGKWFVTSPARVTVRRSTAPLRLECKADDASWAYEKVDSKVDGTLWGNLVLTAGVGYFIDRDTGAGYDYPATLTVIMHKAGAGEDGPPRPAGVTVY